MSGYCSQGNLDLWVFAYDWYDGTDMRRVCRGPLFDVIRVALRGSGEGLSYWAEVCRSEDRAQSAGRSLSPAVV